MWWEIKLGNGGSERGVCFMGRGLHTGQARGLAPKLRDDRGSGEWTLSVIRGVRPEDCDRPT